MHTSSDRYEFYTIDQGDSMIRWTRQQPLHHTIHPSGSHDSASTSISSSTASGSSSAIHYEPFMMQLVDNNAFIDLVLQSSDGVEFDALLHHFKYSEAYSESSSSRSSSSSRNSSHVSGRGGGIYDSYTSSSSSSHDDNDVAAGNSTKARFMIVLIGIDKSVFNRQKKVHNHRHHYRRHYHKHRIVNEKLYN